jgi:hypothetical protein
MFKNGAVTKIKKVIDLIFDLKLSGWYATPSDRMSLKSQGQLL